MRVYTARLWLTPPRSTGLLKTAVSTTILVEEQIVLDLWIAEAPGIRRTFRKALNGDHAVADDLTSETFISLAAALERGTVSDPEALLRTIAQRRLIDEIRRRESDPEFPRGLPTEEFEEDGLWGYSPDTIEAAEFRTDFDSAVRGLPKPERDAFILTELRGLSQEEAAEVLGVSQRTVSGRAESARESLSRALLAG